MNELFCFKKSKWFGCNKSQSKKKQTSWINRFTWKLWKYKNSRKIFIILVIFEKFSNFSLIIIWIVVNPVESSGRCDHSVWKTKRIGQVYRVITNFFTQFPSVLIDKIILSWKNFKYPLWRNFSNKILANFPGFWEYFNSSGPHNIGFNIFFSISVKCFQDMKEDKSFHRIFYLRITIEFRDSSQSVSNDLPVAVSPSCDLNMFLKILLNFCCQKLLNIKKNNQVKNKINLKDKINLTIFHPCWNTTMFVCFVFHFE